MLKQKLVIILAFLPFTVIAQEKQHVYIWTAKPADTPFVYISKSKFLWTNYMPGPWDSYDLITGNSRPSDSMEIEKYSPALHERKDFSISFTIKDQPFSMLAAMKQNILAVSKNKIYLLKEEGNSFRKTGNMPALDMIMKQEYKADQRFIIKSSHTDNRFYFITNSGISSIESKPEAAVTAVIKPIGGLRITNFWLSPNSKYAMIHLIPSSQPYTAYSGVLYNYVVTRVFDLSTGKPLPGIPIEISSLDGSPQAIFSSDDKYILSWKIMNGWEGTLYDLAQNKVVRTFGPAAAERVRTWWSCSIHGNYLYTIAIPNKEYFGVKSLSNIVRVYDLLDSLRPVRQFFLGVNSTYPTPTRQSDLKPSNDLQSFFQPLSLPLKLDGFLRPIPGQIVPPKFWNKLGVVWNEGRHGDHFPILEDSAAGSFQVYAIGTIAEQSGKKLLLVATQLTLQSGADRKPMFTENESRNLVHYYVCEYDISKGYVLKQRIRILEDGQTKFGSDYPPKIGITNIFRSGNAIHFTGTTITDFKLDGNTWEIIK